VEVSINLKVGCEGIKKLKKERKKRCGEGDQYLE